MEKTMKLQGSLFVATVCVCFDAGEGIEAILERYLNLWVISIK